MRFLFIFTIILPITACTGEYLLHRGGCKNGQVRNGSLCEYSTTDAKGVAGCKDPALSKVFEGEAVTLCDGSVGWGTYVAPGDCTKDGDQDCVAKAKFKVVDTSTLTPSDIKNGKTVAGIIGTKRDIKQCRNASNLSYFDSTPQGATVRIPGLISSAAANTITMAWTHGLSTNDPVQVVCSGGVGTTMAGGVVVVGTGSTPFLWRDFPQCS